MQSVQLLLHTQHSFTLDCDTLQDNLRHGVTRESRVRQYTLHCIGAKFRPILEYLQLSINYPPQQYHLRHEARRGARVRHCTLHRIEAAGGLQDGAPEAVPLRDALAEAGCYARPHCVCPAGPPSHTFPFSSRTQ